MAVYDTSAIAAQLKRIYGDRIVDLFARHKLTYNQYMKSDRKASVRPGGAGYYFSLRRSSNEAVGGRAENALLPEPLAGAGVQGTITPALVYAVLRMSGLAMEAGKGDVAAFVDAQGDATMDTYNSLVVDLNRQCHGDSYGLLGTLSAIIDTPSTSATWTGTFNNDRGVRYMRKGMICDFYNGTAIDESASSVRIDSINPTTKVVTFEKMANAYRAYHPLTAAQSYSNAASSIASASFLVRYGARAAVHATTNTAYEIMGLLGMFDDGTLITTFEGVSTTTYPEFVANVLDNSGTNWELSIDLMLAAMDLTATRSSRTVNTIRMGLGQRRKYFALLSPDIRFQPAQLRGGYEQLGFSQDSAVKLVIDPMCQPNKMFFEPDGVIKKYELTEIGWGGFDPNKMHWRQDYDQATMFLRTYTNLGVEERNSLTLLDDLVEPGNNPF